MSLIRLIARKAASGAKKGIASGSKFAWQHSGAQNVPALEWGRSKAAGALKALTGKKVSTANRARAEETEDDVAKQHKEATERAKEAIKPQDNTMSDMAKDIKRIRELTEEQKDDREKEGKGGGLIDTLKSAIGGVLSVALGARLMGTLKRIPGVGGLMRGASRAAGGLWRGAKGLVGGAWRGVTGMFGGRAAPSALTTVAQAANAPRRGFMAAARSGLGTVGNFIKGGATAAYDVAKRGAGLITRGVQGAGRMIGTAASAVRNVGSSIVGNIGKMFGRSAIKKIPVIGALAGLAFGAKRAMSGDFKGAVAEVASGAAATVPGIGTAASFGADAYLMKHDADLERQQQSARPATSETGPSPSPAKAANSPFANVKGGFSTRPDPRPILPSASEDIPGIKTLIALNTMLDLMTDEKKGIFVRIAKDVIDNSEATQRARDSIRQIQVTPRVAPIPDAPKDPRSGPRINFSGIQSTAETLRDPTTPRSWSDLSNQSITPAAPETPASRAIVGTAVSSLNESLLGQTQNAIDRGVKYKFSGKDSLTGGIDCSGWVAEINKNLISGLESEGELLSGSRQARQLFNGPAAGIVENIAGVTGEMLGNDELTVDALKEGMIIGEDNGAKGWDAGRFQGIDHITQVVRDPESGELMISQSSSGKGVNLEPASEYLERKNRRGTRLFGVDTQEAINKVTGGDFASRLGDVSKDSSQMSGVLAAAKTELDLAQQQQNQKPVVIQQAAAPAQPTSRGPRERGGLSGPLVTRNTDTSIQRLTDNFMHSSSPWA